MGGSGHYNNVGCSARLKISFELNPVSEGKEGTFPFCCFSYNMLLIIKTTIQCHHIPLIITITASDSHNAPLMIKTTASDNHNALLIIKTTASDNHNALLIIKTTASDSRNALLIIKTTASDNHNALLMIKTLQPLTITMHYNYSLRQSQYTTHH